MCVCAFEAVAICKYEYCYTSNWVVAFPWFYIHISLNLVGFKLPSRTISGLLFTFILLIFGAWSPNTFELKLGFAPKHCFPIRLIFCFLRPKMLHYTIHFIRRPPKYFRWSLWVSTNYVHIYSAVTQFSH